MKRILINLAHPAKRKSVVNRTLISAVDGLENVTINDLYEHYPDFVIDVKREQALCESHDIIIFQHPFYWYSTPAIVKEWMDLVLEHGWAYGSKGLALKDKVVFQAISLGGDESTYQPDGANQFTIHTLTSPFRATAALCKMAWVPPFIVPGVHRGLPEDALNRCKRDYRNLIDAMTNERIALSDAEQVNYLNDLVPDTNKES